MEPSPPRPSRSVRPATLSDSEFAVDTAGHQVESSDSLYASLVENLPIYVIRKDVAGRVTYVNTRVTELMGRSAAELLGKTDFDLFPLDLAKKYRNDDLCVMETGELFVDVEENQSAGQHRYFEVRKTPVRSATGRIVGTQAIFWDVTEKHRAEQSLAHERDMLRTLMDHLPDLIYVKDAEGKYVIVNESVRSILGLQSVDDVKGKANFDFLNPEQARMEQFDDLQVLRTGTALIEREERITDRHGNPMWVLTSKVPLKAKDGRITGLVGIDRNITRLKRSEDELRAAKESADAANRAKSDFLANVSHEIRTPMNAIIGMTDLLLETPLNDVQREYLLMVQQSGEALLALINDILDFSKIEAGKLELDEGVFDLREGIGDTMKSMAIRAHGKGLELAFHVDPEVPNVLRGDLARLRQVLINLVGNAIKFTDQGEVVLEVRRCQRNGDCVDLQFDVTDTGIGIPPEKCRTIFGEFEQVDASITRRYGGTGLGLAISSKLVTLMGGRIDVRSEPNRGSTFSFVARFPVSGELDATEVGPSQRLVICDTPVLIVDDNATNRRILREMLGNWGMQPTSAADAEEALFYLRQAARDRKPFPLVISDINMPGVDGFQLVEAIYDFTPHDRPAIILLTSGVRIEDGGRWRRLGVSAHLMKPIKQSELFEAVVAALRLVVPDRPAEILASQGTVPRLPPLRILLAEDNLVNQKLATAALESLGHQVTIAHNGRQAVEKSQQESFHAILMDLQMPDMDGLSATKTIRDHEAIHGGHVPIVAMTAHAMKGDREICLQAGMDEYLSKPIRVQDLAQKLWQMFGPGSEPAVEAVVPVGHADIELVNWQAARSSVNDNEPLLREVIVAFVDDVPRLLQELHSAYQCGDATRLRRSAHSLRGSILFLESQPAIDTAQEIEACAEGGQVMGLDTAVARLQSQVDALLHYLRSYLAGDISCPKC